MAITDEIDAQSTPLEPPADCDVQLKQQVQAIAAPLAAAAEFDAKREAHMRAQLAAVQPRQRSTRSSAAQAKKALTRQAAVSSNPALFIGQSIALRACRPGMGAVTLDAESCSSTLA